MSGLDLQTFALNLGLETKAFVGQAIAAALAERDSKIKALEDEVARLRVQAPIVGPAGPVGADGARGLDGKDGRDGKDVDMLAVKALVEATVASVERPDVGALVRSEVVTAMAALPTPKDGRDGANGRDGLDGDDGEPGAKGDAGQNGKDGASGPPGKDGRDGIDGKDAPPVAIDLIVEHLVAMPDVLESAVERYLMAHPPKDGIDGKDGAKGDPGTPGRDGIDGKDGLPGERGKDGREGTDGKDGSPGLAGKDGVNGIDGKDGAPGLHGKDGRDGVDGKDGAPGMHGKDGAGVTGAFIDRDDHLILTLSDGATKDCGVVVGKSVDISDVARFVSAELATWERPKDGTPGLDGKDGLGFDDVSLDFTETTGYVLRFTKGDQEKSFRIAAPWYAGVWQSGRKYPKGAMVTSKGGEWTAKTDTFAKPGQSSEWQLSAKGGRDGKDAPGARDE